MKKSPFFVFFSPFYLEESKNGAQSHLETDDICGDVTWKLEHTRLSFDKYDNLIVFHFFLAIFCLSRY